MRNDSMIWQSYTYVFILVISFSLKSFIVDTGNDPMRSFVLHLFIYLKEEKKNSLFTYDHGKYYGKTSALMKRRSWGRGGYKRIIHIDLQLLGENSSFWSLKNLSHTEGENKRRVGFPRVSTLVFSHHNIFSFHVWYFFCFRSVHSSAAVYRNFKTSYFNRCRKKTIKNISQVTED